MLRSSSLLVPTSEFINVLSEPKEASFVHPKLRIMHKSIKHLEKSNTLPNSGEYNSRSPIRHAPAMLSSLKTSSIIKKK